MVAGSMKAIELARDSDEPRRVLRRNAELFRQLMTEAGFELLPGEHPIVPVMFPGEDGARRASQVADARLASLGRQSDEIEGRGLQPPRHHYLQRVHFGGRDRPPVRATTSAC